MTGATTGSAEDRLRRLIGGPDLAWLIDRARRRLARGTALTGAVTLSEPTQSQRRALAALLGRRPATGATLTVDLGDVDKLLHATGHGGLAVAVTVLTGPVDSLAERRRATETAWRDAYLPLDTVVADRPELHDWRSWLDTTGLIRRLAPAPADAAPLVARLAAVLDRLPSLSVPLGRLAAETCGDAHALDDGRPLGTLALSAARALAGAPFAAEPSAEARRATWAAVGVHLDELSSTVLVLGLTGDPTTPLGAVLHAQKAAGQPSCLTLRQLRDHVGPLRAAAVHVCENPVVVAAAADELGSGCPPLVCVGGRPSSAVWRLLALLSDGGASFRYHGDFDWGGVSIASAVHARVRFVPWRYSTEDYLAAPSGGPLTGRPQPTPWSPSLAAAMAHRAVRIEEELVLDTLLSDLRAYHHSTVNP
ncbi:TIGR02679 family protein [Actinocorallia sp. API 0066]|uniref:TIGR02679 family protein n=1 Tax=Actinocorallia sp. API 0066 TaxID=2896846 RepID=UPI001E604E61|nr:TIGR02679 family protein [Actinocorallia sp. API 0066]MCD0450481.1 TIGR02679 family protein [Actinocorallia sp. API 0066]